MHFLLIICVACLFAPPPLIKFWLSVPGPSVAVLRVGWVPQVDALQGGGFTVLRPSLYLLHVQVKLGSSLIGNLQQFFVKIFSRNLISNLRNNVEFA